MFKKILLYGQCFNLWIAFGFPTQVELEGFFTEQGDNIEIIYRAINKVKFPEKIIFKGELSKDAWENFYAENTGHERVPKAFMLPEPQKRSDEDRLACFEKYSKELPLEALTPMRSFDIGNLVSPSPSHPIEHVREVTFDTIVEKLEVDKKAEAMKWINPDNKEALFVHIDAWIEAKERIIPYHPLQVICSNGEIKHYIYTLSDDAVKEFKDVLKTTLKKMWCYEVARQVLVLSLVLDRGRFCTYPRWGCWEGDIIQCQFYGFNEVIYIQSLTHELNHALHYHLGIEARYSLTGSLCSNFERALFPVPDRLFQAAHKACERVPITMFHQTWTDCDPFFIEIPEEKFSRAALITWAYDDFEELWNTIGFGNIRGTIYVNRMADINFLKNPVVFHYTSGSFESFINVLFSPSPTPLELSTFATEVDSLCVFDLCPKPTAWDVWLNLQNREDAKCYIPNFKITPEQASIAFSQETLIEAK